MLSGAISNFAIKNFIPYPAFSLFVQAMKIYSLVYTELQAPAKFSVLALVLAFVYILLLFVYNSMLFKHGRVSLNR
jgi:membrane protein YdbS with pleckstrin-like domain